MAEKWTEELLSTWLCLDEIPIVHSISTILWQFAHNGIHLRTSANTASADLRFLIATANRNSSCPNGGENRGLGSSSCRKSNKKILFLILGAIS
jgi:hypothetical protein